MKFKIQTKDVPGEYTREGVTVPVTRRVQTAVPALPRDWNSIAMKVAIGVSLLLTIAVIVWSTVKIGGLLHGGVGYVAAAIFDIGWMMALLLAYLSRYNEAKRQFADKLGWGMLIATMGALFWAGLEEGSVAMGVVGAAVSLFAKVIWIGVMKHVNAELSEDDKTWLTAQVSEAQTKAAVAVVRRQAARIEQTAALDMLAMERERADVAKAFGLDTEAAPEVQTPARPALERPTLADMKVADAIRFVKNQCPELEAAEVVRILEDEGIEATPDYVAQVLKRSTAGKTYEPQELAAVVDFRK